MFSNNLFFIEQRSSRKVSRLQPIKLLERRRLIKYANFPTYHVELVSGNEDSWNKDGSRNVLRQLKYLSPQLIYLQVPSVSGSHPHCCPLQSVTVTIHTSTTVLDTRDFPHSNDHTPTRMYTHRLDTGEVLHRFTDKGKKPDMQSVR